MLTSLFFLALSVIFYETITSSSGENPCINLMECGKCMSIPICSWILDDELLRSENIAFGPSRCVLTSHLSGEEKQKYVNVKSTLEEVPNLNGVRVLPHKLFQLNLRPGEEKALEFEEQTVLEIKIDLYILIDMSTSMSSFQKNLTESLESIVNELRLFSLHIGVGSFVDKRLVPFINLNNIRPSMQSTETKSYMFKNTQALTDNFTLLKEAFESSQIIHSSDTPESMFDALQQVIVCDKQINWRLGKDVRRIILVASQGKVKSVLDGSSVLLLRPNRGKCTMIDSVDVANEAEDYIHHSIVAESLRKMQINIYFLCHSNHLELYEVIASFFGSQCFGFSAFDNINNTQLVDKIIKLAKDDRKSYSMSLKDIPDYIETHTFASCGDDKFVENSKACLKINSTINVKFKVDFKTKKCFEGIVRSSILINEKLKISLEIKSLCHCLCESTTANNIVVNSTNCSGIGSFVCGACKCPSSKSGKMCECDSKLGTEMCMYGDTVCNQKGACVCGNCSCYRGSEKYYGDFCECSDLSCPKIKNKICNGQGNCKCNLCNCLNEYTGDDCTQIGCNHREKLKLCVRKNEDEPCSGNGACNCGMCKCNLEYHGEFCENQKYPQLSCAQLEGCIKDNFKFTENQQYICEYKVEWVSKFLDDSDPFHPHCMVLVDQCAIRYSPYLKYPNVVEKLLIRTVKRINDCKSRKNIVFIAGGTILGVIILGFILCVVIYAIYYHLYEKRQYKNLQSEIRKSRWNEVENPMYRPKQNITVNPHHSDT